MPVAVRFSSVSKRFPLNPERHRTYLDLLRRIVGRRSQHEFFWPLKSVSIEIPRSCTVGIIGENGAGKSTVLKLISRVIEPTEGTVQVNGRVSALLELGAGFHPELTGRENIYLNGSLLGIKRAEMARMYDVITHFADIGPFIDVPVKNYSSGMYARLGFAIAINVNPDILLIDEVLAVGDEEFQRRCLDAIRNLQAHGKTIVIVSHSLALIKDLCDHTIWLHDSQVQAAGETDATVRGYLRWVAQQDAHRLLAENSDVLSRAAGRDETGVRPRRYGSGPIRITQVRMFDGRGQASWSFEPREPAAIEIDYEASEAVTQPIFSVLVHKPDGHYLWASNTMDHPIPPIDAAGRGTVRIELAGMNLTAGSYHLSTAAYTHPDPPYWNDPSDFHDWLYNFQVVSDTEIHGDILIASQWQHRPPGFAQGNGPSQVGQAARRKVD